MLRKTHEELRAQVDGACINPSLLGAAQMSVKPKQKIEITEVENGFAVTFGNTDAWPQPKIFIAANVQEATDIIMSKAKEYR